MRAQTIDACTTTELDAGQCYHCGLPVPTGSNFHARILEAQRRMCCPGCEAVANAIVAGGQQRYYRDRSAVAGKADDTPLAILEQMRVYDDPRVQAEFVEELDGERREATLSLEGIRCAACIWLIEKHLGKLPGLQSVSINYSVQRARIVWDESRIHLSDILTAVRSIGYRAWPYEADAERQRLAAARSESLQRLVVAGIFGMQIMLLALALYIGGDEIGPRYTQLFTWVELVLCLPIVGYSAWPFFTGAIKSLTARAVGMDVPVSLGIAGAFCASVWATFTGFGHTYYDSVAMFAMFLLLARHIELLVRCRAGEATASWSRTMPESAKLIDAAGNERVVPAVQLAPGDKVRVLPGAHVPADGIVREGRSTVDESLLTGENLPVTKLVGSELTGGSVNIESALVVEILRTGRNTTVSQLRRLLERAQSDKPRLTQVADRVAHYFVLLVLLVAASVGGFWWSTGSSEWLAITISVLVITCPCALSLATPAAQAAATGALARAGLLVTRGHALETLARATQVIFDKTGTLTEAVLQLRHVEIYVDFTRQQALAIAAALETYSEHPLAVALRDAAGPIHPPASAVENTPGEGVEGIVQGCRYMLGSPAYISSRTGREWLAARDPENRASSDSCVLLANDHETIAAFFLSDRIRDDAATLVGQLQSAGIQVAILSGDGESAVAHVSRRAWIENFRWRMSPAEKLAQVAELQSQGEIVAMVGDGVNDSLALARADVSVAMGGGADIAMSSADVVLISNRLQVLGSGFLLARRTLLIIRQNITWAIAYNLLALPAAAMGFVTPWMAALGMSASSLLVVANSSRLNRIRNR